MVKCIAVELNQPIPNANEGTSSSMWVKDQGQKRKRSENSCHQCHRNDRARVIRCSKCNKKKYCILCLTKRYPRMDEAAFGEACPACRNICNCAACLRSGYADKKIPDQLELSTKDRLQYSGHIVKVFLPVLKQMVAEGNSDSEKQHKIQELLKKAEVHKLTDAVEAYEGACSCLESSRGSSSESSMVLQAACRQGSNDNYLYRPTAENLGCLTHFQWHLRRGDPVIIREVLNGMPWLSWDPLVLWHARRQSKRAGGSRGLDFDVINCSNWCKEKIKMHQFLQGYSNGVFDVKGRPKTLKLENWPSFGCFRERLPKHYLEFLRCLPFKHYTNPNGFLNMELLHTLLKLDLGPKMSISYGVDRDLRWCSVSKLQYPLSDRVNVLMHTSTIHLETERMNDVQVQDLSLNGDSAMWDVFRWKDVSLLEDFLRKHSSKFIQTTSLQHVPHSLLKNAVYLTAEHKEKLKEEYGVEPWTFGQRLGDAVFIPAGCPYQIRNVKSCTNVAIDFVSPESIVKCVRQSKDSSSHMHLEDKIQVEDAILHAINESLEYLDTVARPPSVPVNTSQNQAEGEARPSFSTMRQQLEAMLDRLEREGQRVEPGLREHLETSIHNLLLPIHARERERGSSSL